MSCYRHTQARVVDGNGVSHDANLLTQLVQAEGIDYAKLRQRPSSGVANSSGYDCRGVFYDASGNPTRVPAFPAAPRTDANVASWLATVAAFYHGTYMDAKQARKLSAGQVKLCVIWADVFYGANPDSGALQTLDTLQQAGAEYMVGQDATWLTNIVTAGKDAGCGTPPPLVGNAEDAWLVPLRYGVVLKDVERNLERDEVVVASAAGIAETADSAAANAARTGYAATPAAALQPPSVASAPNGPVQGNATQAAVDAKYAAAMAATGSRKQAYGDAFTAATAANWNAADATAAVDTAAAAYDANQVNQAAANAYNAARAGGATAAQAWSKAHAAATAVTLVNGGNAGYSAATAAANDAQAAYSGNQGGATNTSSSAPSVAGAVDPVQAAINAKYNAAMAATGSRKQAYGDAFTAAIAANLSAADGTAAVDTAAAAYDANQVNRAAANAYNAARAGGATPAQAWSKAHAAATAVTLVNGGNAGYSAATAAANAAQAAYGSNNAAPALPNATSSPAAGNAGAANSNGGAANASGTTGASGPSSATPITPEQAASKAYGATMAALPSASTVTGADGAASSAPGTETAKGPRKVAKSRWGEFIWVETSNGGGVRLSIYPPAADGLRHYGVLRKWKLPNGDSVFTSAHGVIPPTSGLTTVEGQIDVIINEAITGPIPPEKEWEQRELNPCAAGESCTQVPCQSSPNCGPGTCYNGPNCTKAECQSGSNCDTGACGTGQTCTPPGCQNESKCGSAGAPPTTPPAGANPASGLPDKKYFQALSSSGTGKSTVGVPKGYDLWHNSDGSFDLNTPGGDFYHVTFDGNGDPVYAPVHFLIGGPPVANAPAGGTEKTPAAPSTDGSGAGNPANSASPAPSGATTTPVPAGTNPASGLPDKKYFQALSSSGTGKSTVGVPKGYDLWHNSDGSFDLNTPGGDFYHVTFDPDGNPIYAPVHFLIGSPIATTTNASTTRVSSSIKTPQDVANDAGLPGATGKLHGYEVTIFGREITVGSDSRWEVRPDGSILFVGSGTDGKERDTTVRQDSNGGLTVDTFQDTAAGGYRRHEVFPPLPSGLTPNAEKAAAKAMSDNEPGPAKEAPATNATPPALGAATTLPAAGANPASGLPDKKYFQALASSGTGKLTVGVPKGYDLWHNADGSFDMSTPGGGFYHVTFGPDGDPVYAPVHFLIGGPPAPATPAPAVPNTHASNFGVPSAANTETVAMATPAMQAADSSALAGTSGGSAVLSIALNTAGLMNAAISAPISTMVQSVVVSGDGAETASLDAPVGTRAASNQTDGARAPMIEMPRARLMPAAWHADDSLMAFSSLAAMREAAEGNAVSAAPGEITYSLVANGNASGKALELQVHDPSGRLQQANIPEGTVLEPVKQNTAKSVAETAIGGQVLRKVLTAYCVEYTKLPPEAAMLYRIAPQAVQDNFRAYISVLQAGRELAAAGKLHPDSDIQAYKDSIRQYALWAKIEKWDEQAFGEVFVEKTQEISLAAKVKWTKQMAQAVSALVPGRWRDISMVLDEAAKLAAGSAGAAPVARTLH